MLQLIGKYQTAIIYIVGTILSIVGFIGFCWAIKAANITVTVRGCFISSII